MHIIHLFKGIPWLNKNHITIKKNDIVLRYQSIVLAWVLPRASSLGLWTYSEYDEWLHLLTNHRCNLPGETPASANERFHFKQRYLGDYTLSESLRIVVYSQHHAVIQGHKSSSLSSKVLNKKFVVWLLLGASCETNWSMTSGEAQWYPSSPALPHPSLIGFPLERTYSITH